MSAIDLATLPRLGEATASPDGEWLIYSVTETARDTFAKTTSLHLRPLIGDAKPARLQLSGEATAPEFAADGYLYFLFTPKVEAATTDAKPRAQVWRGRVKAGGQVENLTEVSAVEGAIGGFTLSPDGKKIALYGQMPLACETFGCTRDKAYAPGPG